MSDDDAMEDEFDTMAAWTAEAVLALGAEDHAVPAACRGSGTPASMAWLADRLGLGPDVRLLDVGAGVGGPAELVARERGVEPVLAEPMVDACRASRRLFGRPVVVAAGSPLPFGDDGFDAAWSLGVLCTVDDQPGMLAELARVVRPGAPVGLLVYVRTVARLPTQPEGNHFPSRTELEALLAGAGLDVESEAVLGDFEEPSSAWSEAADRVSARIEEEHGDDERWQHAQEQEQTIGGLIGDGLLQGVLLVVRTHGAPSRG